MFIVFKQKHSDIHQRDYIKKTLDLDWDRIDLGLAFTHMTWTSNTLT